MRAVVVVLVALHTVAAADPKRIAAIGKMLEAQRAAIQKQDAAAFEATMTKDAVWSVSLGKPQPGGVGMQVVLTWPRDTKLGKKQVGWAGTWGWVAAELRVLAAPHPEVGGAPRPHVLHYLALVVPDGDGVKTRALQIVRTTADKNLFAYNYVAELPKQARPLSPLTAALAQPAVLGKHLAADPAVAVFGTSPTDRGFGAAAAKKLLASWSKLSFEIVDTKDPRDAAFYEPVELAVGDARVSWARVRMKTRSGWVLLDAFAIGRTAGDRWELVALMYGEQGWHD